MKKYTIWDFMKENWKISKKRIKELGINPEKAFGQFTHDEMSTLADELEIRVSDLID